MSSCCLDVCCDRRFQRKAQINRPNRHRIQPAHNLILRETLAMKLPSFFLSSLLAIGLALSHPASVAQPGGAAMQIFKSPQCGCCGKWADHLDQHGFNSQRIDTGDMAAIKHQLAIPAELQSCHTGRIGDYVFEGHVPADVIQRFLANPPANAYGLAVPGMPVGSPGMEMGERHQDYDVMLLSRDGKHRVYTRVSRASAH